MLLYQNTFYNLPYIFHSKFHFFLRQETAKS
jgi:hypothetical protein